MSDTLVKWKRGQEPSKDDGESRRDDLPKEDDLPPLERRAFDKMQKEAKENGATLANGGRGGLPPSLVLGQFRKAGWKCAKCGTQDDISIHHRGGIPATKKLSRMGHENSLENLEVICESCHDKEHNEARKEGIDSSQVTPAGDEGTKRDKGLPPAKPKE